MVMYLQAFRSMKLRTKQQNDCLLWLECLLSNIAHLPSIARKSTYQSVSLVVLLGSTITLNCGAVALLLSTLSAGACRGVLFQTLSICFSSFKKLLYRPDFYLLGAISCPRFCSVLVQNLDFFRSRHILGNFHAS